MKAACRLPRGVGSMVWSLALALTLFTWLDGPAYAHHVMEGRLPTTWLQGLLSGLGHPVIGLDHFAAVLAIGCIAATQPRGAALTAGFVGAMMFGTAVHIGEANIPFGEILVALSVVALGIVMVRLRPVPPLVALALFTLAGLFHGYALGESIVGAEPAPLYAYLAGLAAIQSGIALGSMALARVLLARASVEPVALRLAGAGIAGFGFALLVRQFGA